MLIACSINRKPLVPEARLGLRQQIAIHYAFPSRRFEATASVLSLATFGDVQQDVSPILSITDSNAFRAQASPGSSSTSTDISGFSVGDSPHIGPDKVVSTLARLDAASKDSKRRAKFQEQAKQREMRQRMHQDFINKGRSSIDWRIPVGILQQRHRKPQDSYEDGQDRSGQERKFLSLQRFERQKLLNSAFDFRNLDPFRKESSPQALVRQVQAKSYDECLIKPARDIPKPEKWSKLTIMQYIEDLTRSQSVYSRLNSTNLSPRSGRNNIQIVVDALDEIFHNAHLRELIPLEAHNIALRFYYSHSMITSARALFIQMEEWKINIPTKTFHIMLRGCALSKDLHNFTFILDKSHKLGFSANAETWESLIASRPSTGVKEVIIRKMRELGMVQKASSRQDSIPSIIQHEMAGHITNCGEHEDILDFLDRHRGSSWLTTSTGNKLLHEYAMRKQVPSALTLFNSMQLRGFVPDQISLQTLLHQCFLLKQHKHVIDTLEVFQPHFDLTLGTKIYEVLFLIAWRNNLLNWARVAWRIACIQGQTSSEMRSKVSRSLKLYTSAKDSSQSTQAESGTPFASKPGKFKSIVGKFVVGVRQPTDTERGATVDADYELRQGSGHSVWAQFEDDLSGGDSPPNRPFARLMSDAYELDKEWTTRRIWSTQEWRHVVHQGIRTDLPVEREVRKVWSSHPVDEFLIRKIPIASSALSERPKEASPNSVEPISSTIEPVEFSNSSGFPRQPISGQPSESDRLTLRKYPIRKVRKYLRGVSRAVKSDSALDKVLDIATGKEAKS